MNKGDDDDHILYIMWHRYGEIWIENLNGIEEDDDFLSVFYQHMKSIRKEETPSAIAINMEATIISERVANWMIRAFHEADTAVRKIAFVGVKKENQTIINRYIKKYHVFFACRFFNGFPEAKNWLM